MEQSVRAQQKRPKLVWVIFVLIVLSIGYTALSLYLVLSGSIPLSAQEREYFQNISAATYVITCGTAALNLAGAIAFFRLRAVAIPLFAAALAISVVTTLYHALTTNFAAALGGPGAIGVLIGVALWAANLAYAWRLKARGVLT